MVCYPLGFTTAVCPVDPVWKSDTDQVLLYLQACLGEGRELPRLILLDLYLPLREQGLQLVHTLKTHPRYTSIPVVMLSQSAEADDMAAAYGQGANAYLIKPSGYENWLTSIAALREAWWESVCRPVEVNGEDVLG